MIDLEQTALNSNVVPPEKVASLLSALKKAPDFSWLLTPPHATEERLQADLHDDFPVALIGPDGKVHLKNFPVLVLNNTCDLQPNRSSFISVAPLIDFKLFAEVEIKKRGETRAQAYLHAIKCNQIFELLWLPSFWKFTEGAIVYLDRVSSSAFSLYEQSLREERRLASFSQNGFFYFLIKITSHLARAESYEVQRH